MRAPVSPFAITRVDAGSPSPGEAAIVTEEPLEIRLAHGPREFRDELRLSVTMRTPGDDHDLVLGFLYTEEIVSEAAEVEGIAPCLDDTGEEPDNVVRAELRPDVAVDPLRWQRNFHATSSCGLCGKSSIEAIHARRNRIGAPWGAVDPGVLTALPDRMLAKQGMFRSTGGIHAAALFSRSGEAVLVREDVGRHNAVDKVIGAALAEGIPFAEHLMLVSGRAGLELVQKCVVAGIPLMAAVGAPSSSAVRLARDSGLALVGFLRGQGFNLYAGS